MSERLELFLQCLRAARPIAQKHPTLGDVVELIDDAIIEAEASLRRYAAARRASTSATNWRAQTGELVGSRIRQADTDEITLWV